MSLHKTLSLGLFPWSEEEDDDGEPLSAKKSLKAFYSHRPSAPAEIDIFSFHGVEAPVAHACLFILGEAEKQDALPRTPLKELERRKGKILRHVFRSRRRNETDFNTTHQLMRAARREMGMRRHRRCLRTQSLGSGIKIPSSNKSLDLSRFASYRHDADKCCKDDDDIAIVTEPTPPPSPFNKDDVGTDCCTAPDATDCTTSERIERPNQDDHETKTMDRLEISTTSDEKPHRSPSLILSTAAVRGSKEEEELDSELLETTDDEDNIFHAPYEFGCLGPIQEIMAPSEKSLAPPPLPPRPQAPLSSTVPAPRSRPEADGEKPRRCSTLFRKDGRPKRSILRRIANKICRLPTVKYD